MTVKILGRVGYWDRLSDAVDSLYRCHLLALVRT